ncbi:MAG: extracellular solute-binding protein [Deltaproteobacteria bacterium]|nr:extracellular solute-binding protein [Deltaproteobacteria bacterium]
MRFLNFLCVVIAMQAPTIASSDDQIVIISPHRHSVQQEIIPLFKEHYQKKYGKKVEVEWLDQGGASDDLRYILARFASQSATSGIDLFWGGGEQPHLELKKLKLLKSHLLPSHLKKEVPAKLGPLLLYDKEETWHAVNFSSFGLFFNKKLLRLLQLEEPKNWNDLADPRYFGHLSNADPRRSSSYLTIYTVMMQSSGWDKGWALLTRIAANTNKFSHSSSAPVKAVVAGEAAAAPSIDYFALAKIGDLGVQNLGFHLPIDVSIVNADPISMLKGAPHPIPAGRFIEFLLDAEVQKLFILPMGAKDGPRFSSLGRLAVNKKTYADTENRRITQLNPYTLAPPKFVLNRDQATDIQFVLSDLIGAVLIDSHKELRQATEVLIKTKRFAELEKGLFPVKKEEVTSAVKKWGDQRFRNQMINHWLEQAHLSYQKIVKDADMKGAVAPQ